MIRRNSHWALSLALILAAASTVVWFSLRSEVGSPAAVEASTAGLRWTEGTTQHYRLAIHSDVLISTDGRAAQDSIRQSVTGVLEVQTLEVDSDGALVGAIISPLSYQIADSVDEDSSRDLSTPIRLRINDSGRMHGFEFSTLSDPLQRKLLEEFLMVFQVDLQSGARWESEEAHASGYYLASYARLPDGSIEKAKLRYLPGSNTDPLPEVVESSGSITLGRGLDWVKEISVQETLVSTDESDLRIEVTTRATLSLIDDSEMVATRTRPQWGFAPVEAAAKSDTRQRLPGHVEDITNLEESLAAWIEHLEQSKEGRTESIHEIRDLLLLDDRVATLLLGALQSGVSDDRTRADLFLAFELAGTEAAQEALCQVQPSNGFSDKDNLRALIALGGVKSPSLASINTLWEVSMNRTQGPQQVRANTASLALGSLGHRLREEGSLEYQRIKDGLLGAVWNARDGKERSALVLAIGNTADPDFSHELIPFLDDENPMVRRSVANALGKTGGDNAIEELSLRITTEPSSAVRGSMAKTLANWKNPTSDSMERIRQGILQEKDEKARLQMAKFLGQNLTQHPSNRESLEDLMKAEQSPKIRKYAGTVLASHAATD